MLISHNAYFTTAAGENHQEVTCMSSAGTHLSPWIVESAYHEKCKLPKQTVSSLCFFLTRLF